MDVVRAEPIDPRYATEVVDEPVYRVDFWSGSDASEEWLLSGVHDFDGARQWALSNARGRAIVIYVHTGSESSTVIRLTGREPG